MSLNTDDGTNGETLTRDGLPMQIKQLVTGAKQKFMAADRRTRIAISAGAGVVVLGLFLFGGSEGESSVGPTYEARRGPLDITVLEGGNVEALKSQQVRSSIRGRDGTQILAIVEEGYRVTPQDVEDGLVLVELDSASLEEEVLNQEIDYETAEASYVERKAELDIQVNQNVSDLNSARQQMKFARLDFEKFLGENIVNELVARLGIDERMARAEQLERDAVEPNREDRLQRITEARQLRQRPTVARVSAEIDSAGQLPFNPANIENAAQLRELMAENGDQIPPELLERMQSRGFAGDDQYGDSPFDEQGEWDEAAEEELLELAELDDEPAVSTSSLLMDDDYMKIRETLDFSVYADTSKLEDGEAKQRLRELEDAMQVAEEDYLQAQARLDGQRRLEARQFITPIELELEEVKVTKAQIRLDSAETDLNLYRQYTFPKDAEQRLADYEEAIMHYQRTVKEAEAELAQGQARFKSAEKRFNLEAERLADLNEQLEMTVLRAQRPGLVVYGSGDDSGRGRNNQEPIQEGTTVRERQPILTIPDMTEMAVRVNIHESAVKRVAEGQKVNVTVDAYPNTRLTGEVIKVAVIADSGNSFMNPDLKVYPSMVKIDGVHDWLRPGMSAQVEIMVDHLEDAVYVPLQSVTYYDDKQVVYVVRNGRRERREVEVGTFSEQYIEILSGLEEGEKVMLLPPQQNVIS